MPRTFVAGCIALSILTLASCQRLSSQQESLQSRLDRHCVEVMKEKGDATRKLARSDAFFSPLLQTCVQIEVAADKESWTYSLQDATHGFMRPPQLIARDFPLHVSHYEGVRWAMASAEGHWQSVESAKDKQLVGSIAARILCTQSDKVCRESDAALFLNVMRPDSHEYDIVEWTADGITADDQDEGECGIGHRLSMNFRTNSVILTDYPKKVSESPTCKAFQSPNSYSLHGGELMFYGESDLFDCTKAGANSAIIGKVREYHGDVTDKNYKLWMDNGEGGQPATLKTPAHPYTQAECSQLMEKKILEFKSDH